MGFFRKVLGVRELFNRRIKRRAASMVELSVAALVSTAVVGMGMYWLVSQQRTLDDSGSKLGVVRTLKNFQHMLRRDMTLMVPANSKATGSLLPPIAELPPFTFEPSNHDSLRIFVKKRGQIQAPVMEVVLNHPDGAQSSYQVRIDISGAQPDSVQQRAIQAIVDNIDADRFFALSNSQYTGIFELKQDSSPTMVGNFGSSGSYIALPFTVFTTADFDQQMAAEFIQADQMNTVRAVSGVRYSVGPDNDMLYRNDTLGRRVRIGKVDSLNFNFYFRGVRNNGDILAEPGVYHDGSDSVHIKHLLDPAYPCFSQGPPTAGMKCVQWFDVNELHVEVSFKTNIPQGTGTLPVGFIPSSDGQHLAYQAKFDVAPRLFASGGGDSSTGFGGLVVEGEDLDLTCANLKTARCKPECANQYTNNDRNAPDWKGYGWYVGRTDAQGNEMTSDYCRCYTDSSGTIHEPTLANHNDSSKFPTWSTSNSDVDKQRAYACASHHECHRRGYGGNTAWMTRMYPACFVMNYCVHQYDANPASSGGTSGGGSGGGTTTGGGSGGDGSADLGANYIWQWGHPDKIKNNVLYFPDRIWAAYMAENNQLRCQQAYSACANRTANMLGLSASQKQQIVSSLENKCGCAVRDFDNRGNPTSAQIENWSLDFNKICNHEFAHNLGTTPVCTNTIDEAESQNQGQIVYKITNDPSKRSDGGLSNSEAAYCACLKDKYASGSMVSNGRIRSNSHFSNLENHYSANASLSSFPNGGEAYDETFFTSSVQTSSYIVKLPDGSVETRTKSCGQASCDLGVTLVRVHDWHSACCANPRPGFDVPSEVLSGYEAYAPICQAHCTSDNGTRVWSYEDSETAYSGTLGDNTTAQQQISRIQNTRMLITGATTVDELPSSCGGYPSPDIQTAQQSP